MRDEQDDSLKNRLKGYREEPDESLWSRINSELPANSIKDQLSNYEEEPDAVVWNSIQDKIGTGQQVNWFARASSGITALALIGIALLYYSFNGLEGAGEKVSDKHTEELSPSALDDAQKSSVPKSADGLSVSKIDASSPVVSKTAPVEKRQKEGQSVRTKVEVNTRPTFSKRRTVAKEAHTKISPVQSFTSNNAKVATSDSESIETRSHPGKNLTDADQTNDVAGRIDSSSSVTNVRATLQNSVGIDSSSASTNTRTALRSSVGIDSMKQDSLTLKEKNSIVKIDSIVDKPAKEERKAKGGTGLYFLIMPTFGYQQLDPVKNDNIIVESLQKISAFSVSRLGIRAEIGWEKSISKRLLFNVGLLYFQRQQTITYNYLDPTRSEIKASDSIPLLFISTPGKQTGTFEYELKNIGIHAGLRYEVMTDRIKHSVGLGVEVHKGLSKSDLELPVSSSLYLFGNIYYRASYPLSSHIDLIVQPTFNYSFKVSDQLGSPFYVKPYGLGLSVGASLKF